MPSSVFRKTNRIHRLPSLLTTSRRRRRLTRSTRPSISQHELGIGAADGLAHEEAARLFDIALHSLESRPEGRDAERLRVDLHARRARSFDALGQWKLEVRELDAALHHLDPEQIELRCEFVLALARAWFLLLDVRPVEQYATEALQLAERLQRSDLAAN